MKKVLCIWLFLVICYGLVSFSNCETDFSQKIREAQLPEHEDNLLPNGDNQGKIMKKIYRLSNPSTVKRAKGSYGGGDLLKPRSNSRSTASTNLLKASVLTLVIKYTVSGVLLIIFFY